MCARASLRHAMPAMLLSDRLIVLGCLSEQIRAPENSADLMFNNSVPAEASAAQPTLRYRGQILTVLFAVAIVAIGAAIYFWRSHETAVGQLGAMRVQAGQAEENFKASRGAIDTVISDLADSLGTATGLQSKQLATIITKIENTVDTLVAKTRNDADARRSQASMYVQFSETYLAIGDDKLAVNSARKGTAIFRALAAAQPNISAVQSDVGLSLGKLSEALRASGDNRGVRSPPTVKAWTSRAPSPIRSPGIGNFEPTSCSRYGGWPRPATIRVSA